MSEREPAKHNLEQLEKIATQLRLHVVNMVAPSGQGYVQQGLGAADIFTSLYFEIWSPCSHRSITYTATINRR